MSSTGQPENNDVTRRQDRGAQMRHPAGRTRIWPLLRTARRRKLHLSDSQPDVLAAISNELQADAELAASFAAFTSATADEAMPKFERLPARSTLANWRAFLNRRVVVATALVAAFVAVVGVAVALAASSPGGHARCAPAYALASACQGSSGSTAGVGGQLQASHLPPASGRP